MPKYPFNSQVHRLAQNTIKGNFGLWFNKLIPIEDFCSCKPCDNSGNKTETVNYYKQKYDGMKNNPELKALLTQKHKTQTDASNYYNSVGYKNIEMEATLISPLITGIGQSHPNEVGMVFDHTIGLPYIPASSMKGLVRFAHTLSLLSIAIAENRIKTEKKGKPTQPYFDDEEEWSNIPGIFGSQKNCGQVIFLDAYPKAIPDLHVDIMNPHYGPYYSKGEPPSDNHNPNPIKFLTVKVGTVFVFRALVKQGCESLLSQIIKAYESALTEEGVGAKTAIGYGRFAFKNGVSDSNRNVVSPVTAGTGSTVSKKTLKEELLSKIKTGMHPNDVKDIITKWKNDPLLIKDAEIGKALLNKKAVIKFNKKDKTKFSENYRLLIEIECMKPFLDQQ